MTRDAGGGETRSAVFHPGFYPAWLPFFAFLFYCNKVLPEFFSKSIEL
jgi:hypothetical protein